MPRQSRGTCDELGCDGDIAESNLRIKVFTSLALLESLCGTVIAMSVNSAMIKINCIGIGAILLTIKELEHSGLDLLLGLHRSGNTYDGTSLL